MMEKNGPDIAIFINGRIVTSANFASRCSLGLMDHIYFYVKLLSCILMYRCSGNCREVHDMECQSILCSLSYQRAGCCHVATWLGNEKYDIIIRVLEYQ